jgi:hypothetical protein
MTTRIALALLATLHCGCAAILKGPHDSFEVHGPPDLVAEDTAGRPIRYWRDKDGVMGIELPTDRTQALVLRSPRRRSVYLLEPSPQPHWALLDLFFTPLNLGLVVDELTGSSYGFGVDALVFSDSAAAVAGIDTIRASVRREPLGLVLVVGWGIANPVSQAVVFYNRYHLGIGYQATPTLAVVGTYADQGCLWLGDFEGSTGHRPSGLCNIAAGGPGLDLRAQLPSGPFLLGSIGRTTVRATDSIFTGDGDGRAPGFSAGTTTIGAGIGFAASFGFLDLRYQRGLERIPIGGDVTARLELLTFTFGLNIIL